MIDGLSTKGHVNAPQNRQHYNRGRGMYAGQVCVSQSEDIKGAA